MFDLPQTIAIACTLALTIGGYGHQIIRALSNETDLQALSVPLIALANLTFLSWVVAASQTHDPLSFAIVVTNGVGFLSTAVLCAIVLIKRRCR
jgi:phosphate/sulfate permease